MTDLDDAELIARLTAADPVDADAVRVAAASPEAAHLLALITRSDARPGRSRRRLAYSLAAAAAVAAVAVPVGLTFVHPAGESAYAAPLVRFAQNSPRLLVGADGWHVTRADEDDPQTGEMTFTSGAAHLDVFWVPGAGAKDSDKLDMTPAGRTVIDGTSAWVGTYDGHEFEALWSVGEQTREARGNFATRAEFLAVARTLRPVGVETWLDAMPADVVSPRARARTVRSMLADIPQPQGFDDTALTDSALVLDRYELGAHVTGTVTCAWLHQWVHGDAAARAQASAAMATARHWTVLRRMQAQGAYPQVLWTFADAINGRPTASTPLNNLEASARSALGC